MRRNPYNHYQPNDPFGETGEDDGWEPKPPGRRWGWQGIFIAIAIIAMLAWEGTRIPPDPNMRFMLDVRDEVALAYGTTDTNSLVDVRETLDANPQIREIVLRNVPGTKDMATNTRIARLFRERGIDTHLDADSYIASGGVHLFLGGNDRTMDCGARIGVHSWQSQDGSNPASLGYDPAEKYMTAFHTDMGAADDFYAFTLNTPHEDIDLLTGEEIERFGLLTGEGCKRWRPFSG